MDRGACELFKEGREQDIRPADVDKPGVVQTVISAPVVDDPLPDRERHDTHATQPRWRSESNFAWLEFPREKSVQNPIELCQTSPLRGD